MLGLALTASAAVAAAGYQSMAPTGQWYGRTFTGLGRGSKQLALTFDDGPNDPHTLRLLDVLAKYDIRATFFLIGKFVDERPDIVREIARAGHVIGNHTYSHRNLIFASADQVRKEIADCERAINDAIGEHSNLFRPPFGGRTPSALRTVRQCGLEPVMWSVTCYEWKERTPEQVVSHAVRQVRGGDIILLHDGAHNVMGGARAHTVEAAERLIQRYHGKGFRFVTVPQMMVLPQPAVVVVPEASEPQEVELVA